MILVLVIVLYCYVVTSHTKGRTTVTSVFVPILISELYLEHAVILLL